MYEHAELLRLESQLTVPTRSRAHLSDLWFTVAWGARSSEWAEGFEVVSVRHNVPVTSSGRVELVPMSVRQGWIVSRGVDLSLYAPADVETIVRGLVAQVNAEVDSPLSTTGSHTKAATWSHRFGAALRASGNAGAGMVSAPRRRAEVDVPSHG